MLFWILVLGVGGYFLYKKYVANNDSGEYGDFNKEYRISSAANLRERTAHLLQSGFPGSAQENCNLFGLLYDASRRLDEKYIVTEESLEFFKEAVNLMTSTFGIRENEAWDLVYAFTDNHSTQELEDASRRFWQSVTMAGGAAGPMISGGDGWSNASTNSEANLKFYRDIETVGYFDDPKLDFELSLHLLNFYAYSENHSYWEDEMKYLTGLFKRFADVDEEDARDFLIHIYRRYECKDYLKIVEDRHPGLYKKWLEQTEIELI